MQTRWRQERGQALLETLLTVVIVFTAVFCIFELGWFMYTYSVLSDAANEGVRYAMVHHLGGTGSTPTTQAVVQNFAGASLHDIRAMTVAEDDVDNVGSYAPPDRVRVTVTYTYVPWLGYFTNPPTMHAYAEGRMVVP